MKTTDTMKHLLLLILMVSLLGGCRAHRTHDEQALRKIEQALRAGDLLFRRGTGLAGQMVTALDREGLFSHVGIVAGDSTEWRVVHAVPYEPEFKGDFDRVKCEPIAGFLGRYPEADFGLYRPQIELQALHRIVRHALRLSRKQVPFDHDYNTQDTTRLYCTELIEYLFGLEGYTLSEGRRTEVNFTGLSGAYIFPSDLTQSTLLTPIY